MTHIRSGVSSGLGASGGLGSLNAGEGAIFLLPLIPIAATVGAIAGASKGVSPEKVKEAETSIKNAVEDPKIQDTLLDKFLEIAKSKFPFRPCASKHRFRSIQVRE